MRSLIVVLDADVLFGRTLRDVLLYVAAKGLFQPRWSAEILDELRRNLVADGWMTDTKAVGLCQAMQSAYGDAEVVGYEHRLAEVQNDPKDRHVAATALEAGAEIIVTRNLRHFVPEPQGVQVESPDEFLTRLLRLDPGPVLEVLRFLEAHYENPPLTLEQVLKRLSLDTPKFVKNVRGLVGRKP